MTKLIVFDLDGTLLNTLEDIANSCNYALGQCGYPTHEIKAYRYFVGSGIRNLIVRALPEAERTEENALRIEEHFYPHYDIHKCDKTAPYLGIVGVLKKLQEKGTKIAVATNKYQEGADGVIAEYFPEIQFDIVLGQVDTRPIKPAPDIVFEAMKFVGAQPDETIYIGDSDVDMKTGLSAGVRTVGVTWGFREEAELAAYKPWRIIDNVDDILIL